MRKVIVIAVREYQAAVKTKAFIISLILMPILGGGAMAVAALTEDRVDTKDKQFAVLDYSGKVYDAIARSAREWNTTEIFTDDGGRRKQIKPRFLISEARADSDDPADATFKLSQRVRRKEILGFVIVGPDVIEPGAGEGGTGVKYHSNSPTYDDFKRWVSGPINDRIRQLRFAAADLDPEVVSKATAPVYVQNLGLVSLDEEGNVTEAERTNQLANMFVPMGMMMLMFMVIMVGAQPLMQSVLEEKMQRIAEVLLGAVGPFQLMMGKLIGMVGVAMTIATIYLAGAFFAVTQSGYGHFFPVHVIWWFVLYLALAVLMFGSVFAAVGAAATDMKETQSLVMPVMMVVMIPMFVWIPVVKEPSSTFSIVMSLIPPATPMLMMMRQAVPPGVPLWQPLLGVFLVLLTTVLCVFAAGRVFRVGILLQGKGARFSELLRWALRG